MSAPKKKEAAKFYFGGASRNSGGAMARFANHKAHADRETASLRADHWALTEGKSQFPTRLFPSADVPRILVSGHNSAKVGKTVRKGPWKGMPIYTVTLEERATCPKACHLWRECYGNAMPLARRVDVDSDFFRVLDAELRAKATEHKRGFVLRLHVLGDFFSEEYVKHWLMWLTEIPQIHAFGYTANRRGSKIGDMLTGLNGAFSGRWVIRFSVPPDQDPQPLEATTIWRQPESYYVPEGQVCPVSLGKSDACGSCGLCWSPSMVDERIVFVGHGMNRRGRRIEQEAREVPGFNGFVRKHSAEARDEMLRLWLQTDPQLSSAEIAAQLKVTKNVVLGVAHREGFPSRPSPIKKLSEPRVRVARPVRDRPTIAPVASQRVVEPKKEPQAPVAAVPLRSSLTSCCWPIGEPRTPSFRFCDEASVVGRPYCPIHCDAAYVPAPRRQEFA